MYYIVASYILRNLKSVGVGTNSFYDLIGSKPFACQAFTIGSLHLKVSSIDQDPIVNVELSRFFHIKGVWFIVAVFEYGMNMVLHCSHSFQPFFCGRRGEFVVVIEVYGVCIKAIVGSVWGEIVGSGGCWMVGKFCER